MIPPLLHCLLAAALAATPAHPAPRRAGARPAASAPLPGAAAPVRRPHGARTVVHATLHRAYLDAGAAEGLQPDQVVRLVRRGEQVGACRVEAVALHHAACRLDGARAGDTFAVAGKPAPAQPAVLRPLSPEQLERRAAAVAAASVAKVEFKPKPDEAPPVVLGRRAEVVVGHATWAASASGPWQQERLDLAVRGAEIGAGFRLYADLRALHWSVRPEAARFRPDDRSQLYVWEAQLSSRDGARPLTLALGRVLPFGIPGATVLDGVQVGWQRAGGAELGVFGGGAPDLETLAPTLRRATGGAYGAFAVTAGAFAAHQDARLAVVTSPELGTRLEGELRSLAVVGRSLQAAGDLRFGVGGDREAPARIDGANLDLSARPLPALLLSGGFRYWGLAVPDVVAPARFAGPERRGDVAAGWDLGGVILSATGGYSRDLGTGLDRGFAGPELAIPRLFGARGGVTFGYLEERGWLAGRSAFAQAVVQPLARLRLTGRVSYAADRVAAGYEHELGAFASVDATLTPWLALRAAALVRVGAADLASAERSLGLTGRIGLAGAL